MEGPRFLLAIMLSIAVVIAVNLLFPPTPPPGGTDPDTTAVEGVEGAEDTLVEAEPGAGEARPGVDRPDTAAAPPRPQQDAVAGDEPGGPTPEAVIDPGDPAGPADTVWVRTDVAMYGFSTRGAALVSAELLGFDSYTRPGPVQLVEPDDRALLEYGIRADGRRIPLGNLSFEAPGVPDTLYVEDEATLTFQADVEGGQVVLEYTFESDRYLLGFGGLVTGFGEAPTLLLDLGPKLAVNEADSAEDLRYLAYVVNSRRTGIESMRIDKVEEDRVEEGPLNWVALKNKYFLAAAIEPHPDAQGFGGLLAGGTPEGAESVVATWPTGRDGSFDLRLFFGPQEYDRLAALGEGIKDVNPYGWRIFRPIIRPLAEIITWMLTGLHNVLGFGYGWVLILFGFAIRGVLWPLNAKAMRSQLKTMELQPRIKEIQQKYKEKPEQLQKEMVRLYKEEGFNPLGGCVPMLIPWPVLITLFFVFQNTIEFRGVDFLWLPDLSRPDPYYILPVIMGASLWAIQYMNVRVVGSDNPQQKMLLWVMPIMMTVIFLNFASGLNLYYAASNVASLPQQIQIVGERKRAKARMEAKKTAEAEAEARA